MQESKPGEKNQDLPASSAGLVLPDQILPPNLFVLPVSTVVFPTLMAPILVSEPRFVATVEEAINRQRLIGLLLPRSTPIGPDLKAKDLHDVGVTARIMKRIRMPDGSVNLLIHSIKRFKVVKPLSDHPHIVVEAEYISDSAEQSNELDALTRTTIALVKKLSEVNPFFTEEMRLAMINAPGPGTVADLVAFALGLPKPESQAFLETFSVKSRFETLIGLLQTEQDVADLQKKIQDDVNTRLNTMQREYFLKEQLKVIKKELGLEEDGREKNSRSFRERIDSAEMPDEVKKLAIEEVNKFETISESSPEYNMSRTYLETLCSMPWSKETSDNLDIEHAQNILNRDHFGLEKIKERILEFLAVRQLSKDPKKRGSILCLVGPPGVGKTSVGKSIAQAMGRNFFRFSLGGVRDEAEIKGHRRTYVGAMPGKIIQGLRRAGTRNPVLMLDEIDKMNSNFHGDPSAALLEVLDPEQNSNFLDHYLDVPFDLSRTIFIATANTTATIPAPLLDRMEVIELSGYTLEEKHQIATQYVVPKVIKEHGLKSSNLRITSTALKQILSDYSREAGLRTLQQQIEKLARKAALLMIKSRSSNDKKKIKTVVIKKEILCDWLGSKKFYNEVAERISVPGVVVGLAWTAAGGDILFIESTDIPGSGQLKLTGQMGEVMTESASIAWSYVKRKSSDELGLKSEYFKDRDFHLHIPAGAIPKDGPSAGITMATALYSMLSQRKSKQKIAMTGELSLTGKVLPVGGIKEKLLAARRSGVTEIILPELNRKDLAEIPDYVMDELTLHWVSDVEQVFRLALDPEVTSPKLQKTLKQKVLKSAPKKLNRPSISPQKIIS